MSEGIPCGHGACSHTSESLSQHLNHGSLHFTASVMGNPEYLDAVKNITPAKDQRMEGLEKLNTFHAKHHADRELKQKAKE